jgi:hypothetical protein
VRYCGLDCQSAETAGRYKSHICQSAPEVDPRLACVLLVDSFQAAGLTDFCACRFANCAGNRYRHYVSSAANRPFGCSGASFTILTVELRRPPPLPLDSTESSSSTAWWLTCLTGRRTGEFAAIYCNDRAIRTETRVEFCYPILLARCWKSRMANPKENSEPASDVNHRDGK